MSPVRLSIASVTLAFVLIAATRSANAEMAHLVGGWGDMPGLPCTKWEGPLFGGSFKSAPQRWYFSVAVDSNAAADAAKIAGATCIGPAVAAAGGISAITGNFAVAWPVFQASFLACMKTAAPAIAVTSVSGKTYTQCDW
jgi:hypothetical protein